MSEEPDLGGIEQAKEDYHYRVWMAVCLDCGDEWSEQEQPKLCPECFSLSIRIISSWIE